ncbi:MAG: hypothetical protein WA951_09040 [Leeuwenhoekiella sp.]
MFNIYFLLLFVGVNCFAQVSKAEQDALKDIYRFTNGDTWTVSWDLNKDVSTWEGVLIEDDKIVGIDLSANNLMGELPSSLGNLTHLKNLNLASNVLSGELPDQLADLENLETLTINGNALSGEIPEDLYKLKRMRNLKLENNVFESIASTNE